MHSNITNKWSYNCIMSKTTTHKTLYIWVSHTCIWFLHLIKESSLTTISARDKEYMRNYIWSVAVWNVLFWISGTPTLTVRRKKDEYCSTPDQNAISDKIVMESLSLRYRLINNKKYNLDQEQWTDERYTSSTEALSIAEDETLHITLLQDSYTEQF